MQSSPPGAEENIQQIKLLIDDLTQKLQTLPNENLNGLAKDIQDLKGVLARFPNELPILPGKSLFEIDDRDNQFLTTLFQVDPGGIAVVTFPDLVYHLTNQAYRAMTPHPEVDPMGRSMGTIWPDRDVEGTRAIFGQVLATGEGIDTEYQLLYPGGRTRYFTAHVMPIRWKGAPALLQIFWETTQLEEERKALAEANSRLEEERIRLLTVIRSVPVGLAIYDAYGGVIEANQSYEEVWGSNRPPAYSVEDYDRYKAWWVDSGKRVLAGEWAAAQAVEKGKTVIGQYLCIQKFDGSRGYVLNSGAPIRNAKGEVIGAVVTIMDISEHVQIEQALRESEERFRVALSALPMMVYRMDTSLRYTWIYNPHPVYKQEDFLGKGDSDLFPKDVATPFILAKRQAIETGRGVQREVSALIDGEMKTYLLTLEPIFDDRMNVTGLIGASLDVTDQRRIEKERLAALAQSMIQRQLLENREKERQAIARDLHDGPIQLLSSTLFNLQVLKEATEDAMMQLEISQASLNLKTTVRDLRSLMNELRPPALIRFGFVKSARMHADDFRERHPELELNLRLTDDEDILSENAHLAFFRIYQESLNNIIKHASATKIWVQLTRNGDQVRLHIHDNGQGFTVPADFTQQTRHGHYGLAGMKERAEALGGKFTILSVPGSGTTITVIIPIRPKVEP